MRSNKNNLPELEKYQYFRYDPCDSNKEKGHWRENLSGQYKKV
jgi:hypothetical protein